MLALLQAPSVNAYALSGTCGTQGNYFDGFLHNPNTHSDQFIGASGFITNRYAATCSSDMSSPVPSNNSIGTNFTTSWVMIAANDLQSWSQVGVIAGWTESDFLWAEVLRNSPFERYDRFAAGGSITFNQMNAFYEKYVSNCPAPTNGPCEESLVNSVRITDTNFNPFSYFVYHPPGGAGVLWSPQYFGEKTYQESNIMGSNTLKTNFQQIGVQQVGQSSFVLEPCTLSANQSASRSGLVAQGCYNFDIWTTS